MGHDNNLSTYERMLCVHVCMAVVFVLDRHLTGERATPLVTRWRWYSNELKYFPLHPKLDNLPSNNLPRTPLSPLPQSLALFARQQRRLRDNSTFAYPSYHGAESVACTLLNLIPASPPCVRHFLPDSGSVAWN